MLRILAGGLCACAATMALTATPLVARAADRAVVWLRADERNFERELNREAARGLRLAAISDGLPCTVAAMQTPERASPPAAYRVVPERELVAALPDLVAQGFVPTASARTVGTRHQVVFERTTTTTTTTSALGEWRVIEFEKLEDLDGALATASGEGFQVALAVRPPFRSWPGLSEKGLVLAMKSSGAVTRQSRVLIGTKRDLKDVTGALTAATTEGWTLDGLLTSARDGGRDGRRERVVLMLSRATTAASGTPVGIERHTSFGLFGSGTIAGAGVFWNDYLTAWVASGRRQNWATPIQLSSLDASCIGIEFKLRFDGMSDQTWNIVALLAKPREPGGYELVVVTETRVGAP